MKARDQLGSVSKSPEAVQAGDSAPLRMAGSSVDCISEEEALSYVHGIGGDKTGDRLQLHLDVCVACRVTVGEAARAMAERENDDVPVSSRNMRPLTLARGERIVDRYDIVRFIARGGMGEVYEAYDSVLRETVALKTLICTALDNSHAMSRLRAEVRLARQVTHPNVCRIMEFGVHRPVREQGRPREAIPFLTMEFLRERHSTRELSERGRCLPSSSKSCSIRFSTDCARFTARGSFTATSSPPISSCCPEPASASS